LYGTANGPEGADDGAVPGCWNFNFALELAVSQNFRKRRYCMAQLQRSVEPFAVESRRCTDDRKLVKPSNCLENGAAQPGGRIPH
jgi:hypothetical protein